MSPLLDALEPALAGVLSAPFALFGCSMGALIAFDLSRRLVESRRAPVALFVAAARAPHVLDGKSSSRLPEADLIEEIRPLNGTPERVLADRELMALVLPTLRADLEVIEMRARSEAPPLPCPTIAYGGDGDPRVSMEQLEAWREAARLVAVRTFAGGHHFVQTSRREVLDDLVGSLAAIESRPR
jgi:surfactin synthase thioesterase subunit